MTAMASDHLELSARLGSRHRQTEALQVHRDYLKQEIRRHSQDLATQALRFTDLDRALVRHGGSRVW